MRDRHRLRPDFLEHPDPGRLALDHPRRGEILAAHGAAVGRRMPTYRDPLTGYSVFTARFLADRGYCCDSGCRHCPYTGEHRGEPGTGGARTGA